MTGSPTNWLHRIIAILIGDGIGTVIFIGGPIAIARLQGHTAADAMWMLRRLPEFLLNVAVIGAIPALLLSFLFLRRVPALWMAIAMGILVALCVMLGSILYLAWDNNLWQPIFLTALLGAAVNQLLQVILAGAVAGVAGWLYMSLTARHPKPSGPLHIPGATRSASTYTIH